MRSRVLRSTSRTRAAACLFHACVPARGPRIGLQSRTTKPSLHLQSDLTMLQAFLLPLTSQRNCERAVADLSHGSFHHTSPLRAQLHSRVREYFPASCIVRAGECFSGKLYWRAQRINAIRKTLCERRNVFRTIAQRRQDDRYCIQSIKKIVAKPSRCDFLFDVAIARRDHAHIYILQSGSNRLS